jgi:pilus assembly protein TadC
VVIAVLGGTVGLVAALPSGAMVVLALRGKATGKTRADPRSIAFVLDLIACSLSAGAPPERAIAGVADAVEQFGSPEHWAVVQPLQRVGRLLQLGTDPVQAWTALDAVAGYGTVAAAGRRCASSGARLAAALSAAAVECRATQRSQAVARAERVGVLSLLPLGLCFLPAFVCIGVAPVVAGIAGDVLAGVPT